MFTHGFLLVFCVLGANSAIVKNEKLLSCNDLYYLYEMSDNMNETIAHTIHSMTVQGLRMFNPRATENNQVPTVNHDISDEVFMPNVFFYHNRLMRSYRVLLFVEFMYGFYHYSVIHLSHSASNQPLLSNSYSLLQSLLMNNISI